MDASADKPHILVVDDDTRLRELLRNFLSKNGFRVTVAGHAAEARERLGVLDFDLIVLDVMMPGQTGVDDYLGKPFEPRELLLRIQNVLKRNRTVTAPTGEPQRLVMFGPFQFDHELGELTNKGKRVPLTDAETALLRILSTRLGEVLSRETLCKSLGVAVNERAIDVQVTRLRRKIEPDPSFPRYLRTVRGQGYRLVDA
jgi:two-component system phosphate regulon response regulator OmpR